MGQMEISVLSSLPRLSLYRLKIRSLFLSKPIAATLTAADPFDHPVS